MGPAGAVQCHLHQGFIEGCQEMTEAVNALAITEGLAQGLTDGDADIFIGVVVIDVGITAGADLQIKQAVAGDLVEHVIEKRHPGAHVALSRAIELEDHSHIGLTGLPVHLPLALSAHARSALTPC